MLRLIDLRARALVIAADGRFVAENFGNLLKRQPGKRSTPVKRLSAALEDTEILEEILRAEI